MTPGPRARVGVGTTLTCHDLQEDWCQQQTARPPHGQLVNLTPRHTQLGRREVTTQQQHCQMWHGPVSQSRGAVDTMCSTPPQPPLQACADAGSVRVGRAHRGLKLQHTRYTPSLHPPYRVHTLSHCSASPFHTLVPGVLPFHTARRRQAARLNAESATVTMATHSTNDGLGSIATNSGVVTVRGVAV